MIWTLVFLLSLAWPWILVRVFLVKQFLLWDWSEGEVQWVWEVDRYGG